jgi:hypothetical protein
MPRMLAAGVGFLGLGLGALAVHAATTAAAGNPTPAVWKEQRVTFLYRGLTARYSCEGLRDKVRAMLLDLGARRDVRIAAAGCADVGLVEVASAGPSLTIVFSVPVLPDETAKPLHQGDLAATDARFETFAITSDAFRNMGIGDCELVQEFTRQILPKFVTRALKQDVACMPSQPSSSRFMVQGEILKALPRAEQSADSQPVRVP